MGPEAEDGLQHACREISRFEAGRSHRRKPIPNKRLLGLLSGIWIQTQSYRRSQRLQGELDPSSRPPENPDDTKIVEIGEKSMTFAIPPGQLRYARDIAPESSSNPSGPAEGESAPAQEDVILCKVENVRQLETKILEVDGRIKNTYPVNSWKMIRCQRNNQDLGSLFDVRESYWNRTHPR